MHLPRLFAALALISTPFAQDAHDTPNTSGVEVPELPEFETGDAARYGFQIADYADRFDQGWTDEVWQGRMDLYDARGDSVQRKVVRMLLENVADGDKSIVRFESPAEIKGVAALTHDHPGSTDDNWLYLPATKKVRRISGANKTASFQGTEFTYEDLSSLELTDYEWRFVDETTLERDGQSVPVLRVEARPTYKDTGYSRLVIAYHKELWRRERVEYYDKAGVHLKTFDSRDWRSMHGRFWRAYVTEMSNLQTGKRTNLTFDRVFLNLALYTSKKTGEKRANLTDERFTTRAIGSK